MVGVIREVVAERTASAIRRLPEPARQAGAEQVGVAAGQLAAGVGNLAFALIAARILDPRQFAQLASFLALYLVVNLPATSISAAAALSPDRCRPLARRTAWAGLGVGAVLVGLSPALGPALSLPIPLVIALGASAPVAGTLAVQRGRLYGWRRHRAVVASLVSEPAVRLSLGVLLCVVGGAVGGAAGVVVAGYAALEVIRRHRRRWRAKPRTTSMPSGASPVGAGAIWAGGAFALLAVLQNQDLLFANAILPSSQAGSYAALSTLGGIAAFATVTIPLVLLPRAIRSDRHALRAAVGLAALLGVLAVCASVAAPGALVASLFGSRYAGIAPLVVPYLAGMGALGIARVVVAYRCATGAPKLATGLTAAAAAGQACVIALAGSSDASIAWTTVGASAALAVTLGVDAAVRNPEIHARLRALAVSATQPIPLAVGALTMAGLAVRCIIPRGIWLDEATSIHQAGMGFGAMISNLRTTDVHPPLYFSVLWVFEHVFGNGDFAMRVPSILAGSLIVPAAYVAARDLWDRRTGVVCASVATVAPIVVWYSQEARMYSMFMLFALLAIWGQVRALRSGRARDWALFSLASAALGWTEYFGLIQVVTQQAVFAVVAWRTRDRRPEVRRLLAGWAASLFVTCALLAPLVPFVVHQFLVNQHAGKGFGATPSQVGLKVTNALSIYSLLANVVWALVGYHSAPVMAQLVALWPLGIFACLFVLGRKARLETMMVVAVAVVPTLLLFAVGHVKQNLFDIRYLSSAVMAALLLTARLVTGTSRSLRLQAAACVALVAILGASLFDEQVNGSNPRRYDFRSALAQVHAEFRPGDRLLYDPADLDLVVGYYAGAESPRPFSPASATVPPGGRLFILASKPLMNAAEPGVLGRTLSRLDRADRLVGVIRKSNVAVWVYRAPIPARAAP